MNTTEQKLQKQLEDANRRVIELTYAIEEVEKARTPIERMAATKFAATVKNKARREMSEVNSANTADAIVSIISAIFGSFENGSFRRQPAK